LLKDFKILSLPECANLSECYKYIIYPATLTLFVVKNFAQPVQIIEVEILPVFVLLKAA
jgi:hypothetical protein